MEEKERELLTEEALLERQRALEQKEEELKKKESVLQKAEEKIAKTICRTGKSKKKSCARRIRGLCRIKKHIWNVSGR